MNLFNLNKYFKFMYSKIALNNCKCNHCQEKLKQINRSIAYWEKLILSKNLA